MTRRIAGEPTVAAVFGSYGGRRSKEGHHVEVAYVCESSGAEKAVGNHE